MKTNTESNELVVFVLPSLVVAEGAADRLRTAVYEGRFGASDWVIAEHVDGKVRLHHRKESGAARGFGEGAVLGGIAGLLIGSVLAPALIVGAAGAAAMSLYRGGIPKEAMEEIGAAVADGETALFILTDANSARIITSETFASSTVRTFTIDAVDGAAVRDAAGEIAAAVETPPWDPFATGATP
jgi:uncharacterized membrane protein